MALPDQPHAPQAWWIKFEDYTLHYSAASSRDRRIQVIRGAGTPHAVPMWDLLTPVERRPAFAAFAEIRTAEDCLSFAKQYSLLGTFSARYPFEALTLNDEGKPESSVLIDGAFGVEDRATAIGRHLILLRLGPDAPLEDIRGFPVEQWDELPGFPRAYDLLDSPEEGVTWVGRAINAPDEFMMGPHWGMNVRVYVHENINHWLRNAEQMRGTLEAAREGKNVASAVSANIVGLRLTVKRKASGSYALEWRPASLLTGLWLQLAQHLTGGAELRLCANCGRLFVPDEPRVKYCSYRCRIKRQNDKARGKLKTDRKEAKQDAKNSTRTR